MKQHKVIGGRWVVHEPHREAGPYWHCRIRDLVTGRTTKFSTREVSRPRARQAAIEHAKTLEARAEQIVVQRGFKECFAEYLEHRSICPKTRADYESFGRIMAEAFEGLAVDEVDGRKVERFVKELKDRGRAPKTVSSYVTLLRSFYRWAIRHGHALSDPTQDIKASKARRIEPAALTFEEARRLLEACRETCVQEVSYSDRNASKQSWHPPGYLYLATLVALYTGLRRANVFRLQWHEINLTRRAIRIAAKKMKARRDHEVPIHPVLAEALRARLREETFPGCAVDGVGGSIRKRSCSVRRLKIPGERSRPR
jgi:integrase